VPKESANVDHIPELADAALKIVAFEESWYGPSLPPDRLYVALVPCFHFNAMENCGLIAVLGSSLARRLRVMR
jgi:aminopeptidase N